MINQNFYQKSKAVKTYMGGRIAHYLRKSPTVVLTNYEYPLQERENMYSLGAKVFGDSGQNLWPIIAENNRLRNPDEWEAGEIVYLPEVILNDSENRIIDYESTTSSTTGI